MSQSIDTIKWQLINNHSSNIYSLCVCVWFFFGKVTDNNNVKSIAASINWLTRDEKKNIIRFLQATNWIELKFISTTNNKGKFYVLWFFFVRNQTHTHIDQMKFHLEFFILFLFLIESNVMCFEYLCILAAFFWQ